MTSVFAQVRFNTPSGAMVNTFNFSTGAVTSYVTLADSVAAALQNFYTQPAAGLNLAKYMAPWVSRNVEIRTYDPTTAKPRVPTIYGFTMVASAASGAASTIPMDVALCLSYHAAPPVTRHRRGRVYIGGCTTDWMVTGTVSAPPVFNIAATSPADVVKNSAVALIASATGWSIYSRAANTFSSIIGGYIDNEPDTQRRRGSTTSSRLAFGV